MPAYLWHDLPDGLFLVGIDEGEDAIGPRGHDPTGVALVLATDGTHAQRAVEMALGIGKCISL